MPADAPPTRRAAVVVNPTKVSDPEALEAAIEAAREHDPKVVVEAAVFGREIECGVLVDADGRVVGEHDGTFGFTVGQRRGLGVALGEPTYVLEVDAVHNRVVVA